MQRRQTPCPHVVISEEILDDIVVTATSTPTPLSSTRNRRRRPSVGSPLISWTSPEIVSFRSLAALREESKKSWWRSTSWHLWAILVVVACCILVR